MRYQLGSHTIDEDARELRVDGRPAELEPRTFDVLCHLVRHHDRVVPKEELLDTIWGDRFVSESALTTAIKHARKALGDDGRTQGWIRTVHRVGYRFIGEVTPAELTPPTPPRGAHPGADDRDPAGAVVPLTTKRLFGRNAERATLAGHLREHRIVTVLGPGGVGKSTLCAEVAAGWRSQGPVWWCDLADAASAGELVQVVLRAVRGDHQSDAGATESVLRSLERRCGLLVLDNCEHLLGTVTALVAGIVRRCPEVVVLATSRVTVGVGGEVVMPLGPLDLDDAVTCFCSRARDAGVAIEPSDPAVAELCDRLDRLPLALELAAARTPVLEPARMVDLLHDRFRLLADAHPGSDARHTSLEAVIGWSWDTAEPRDQHLLAALSAFAGAFSLDDAVAIGQGLDLVDAAGALDRLLRSSLVVPVADHQGQRRFRLLESVRAFGSDRVGDPASLHHRHGERMAELAETLDHQMQSDAIDAALASMTERWSDLGAAVRRAAGTGDVATAHRILRAVAGYADLYQRFEVLEWCEQVATAAGPGDDPVATAEVQALRARMLAHRGRYDRARRLANDAHGAVETYPTLLSVVWCAYYQGDLDVVVDGAERLVDLCRSARGMDRAYADGFAAIVSVVRQESDGADPAEVDALLARADHGVLATTDCMVGGFRRCASDPGLASRLLEATVQVSLRRDYRLLLGAAGSTLTQIAVPARPLDEALGTLSRTLSAYRDRGMWTLISADLVMAASLLAQAGDPVTAGRLLGAREASGYHVGLSELHRQELTARLNDDLGTRLDAVRAEGRRWNPIEAADAALDAIGRQLAP